MINEFKKRLITSLILIPISIFFIIKGSIFFIFFLCTLFLVTTYEWIIMSKKNNLLKFLGIIFLIFSFYAAFEFRVNKDYKDFLFISAIMEHFELSGLLQRVYNNRYSVFKKCIWALLLLASYKICIDLCSCLHCFCLICNFQKFIYISTTRAFLSFFLLQPFLRDKKFGH